MNEYDSNRIYDLAAEINYKKTNSLKEAELLCVKHLSHQRKSYRQSLS